MLWAGDTPAIHTVRAICVDGEVAEVEQGIYAPIDLLVPIEAACAAGKMLTVLQWCVDWIADNCEPPDTGEGQEAARVLNTARMVLNEARGLPL